MNTLFFIKKYTSPRISLKESLNHLQFNILPNKKLSRIISKNNTHLSRLREVNLSYMLFLQNLKEKEKKTSTFILFLFLLEKDIMYNLLDYALFFWSKPLNILFRLEWVSKRGKPTVWIRYISSKRRFLLVWRWLSLTVRLLNISYNNFLISFFSLWELFFLNPIATSKINLAKLRVYKVYMYKLY